MAIVIRHGSNGAMKSATAVDRYLIPAIKQGRTVVTNLRGVSLERCYQVFPYLPESLDVIFVDTETMEGKRQMARWFHWAPLGALLIFDEASSLFPKSWRESDIKALDYPGGLDKATQDGRPYNWLSAWEMHRHFNWDIVLTTPNIKNIRDDIRNTTEMAYRQRSLGKVLSEKFRRYKEIQHDAVKNGFALSDAISISSPKISKVAFELYDSTKTGIAQGSNAGKSVFANPKVLLLGAVLLGCVGFVAVIGGPSITREAETGELVPIPQAQTAAALVGPGGGESAPDVFRRDVGPKHGGETGFVADPLADRQLRILGSFDGTTQILVTSDDSEKVIMTPAVLSKLGYAYFPVSACVGRLEFKGQSRLVLCGQQRDQRAEASSRSGDA